MARNADKLAQLAAALPADQVTVAVADFASLANDELVVRAAIEALGGVDVALIAHGELGDQLESERSFAAAEATIVANFTSAVALLIPLANHMESAGAGTLGVITSVAGERGRPRNYTYGAAKGALNVYLQGLRSRLHGAGVKVTTLKLGPVDTPMTRTHRKTPVFVRPERAARGIVAALDAGVAEAYVPGFWAAIMPIVKHTPERLFQALPFLSGQGADDPRGGPASAPSPFSSLPRRVQLRRRRGTSRRPGPVKNSTWPRLGRRGIVLTCSSPARLLRARAPRTDTGATRRCLRKCSATIVSVGGRRVRQGPDTLRGWHGRRASMPASRAPERSPRAFDAVQVQVERFARSSGPPGTRPCATPGTDGYERKGATIRAKITSFARHVTCTGHRPCAARMSSSRLDRACNELPPRARFLPARDLR